MLAPNVPDVVKGLGLTLTYFDDFVTKPLTGVYTHLVADTTPTVTNGDVAGGAAKLFTDTTDNNEVAIATGEFLLFAQDKPWYVQGRVRWAENDTNKANVYFGVSDALAAANLMVDNGAGPKTSGSMAGFFKVDGGTTWKTIVSKSTTQTTNTTEYTSVNSSSAWHTLGILCDPIDATNATVSFYIDTAGGNNLLPARIASQNARVTDLATNQVQIAISSATEMALGLYVKTGGGSGGETVYLDYLAAYGKR